VDFEDRQVTVTPEGISLDLVLAGLGSRFAAFLLDFVLQLAAFVVFLLALLAAFHGTSGTASALVAGGAISLFALVDFIGYFIFSEMLFNGRTLGKRAAGLRVVKVGGQPVGFWSSLLRNLVRLVDMQLGLTYLVGSVLILATNRNQRLGDLLAGTLVVRDRVAATRVWKDTPWTNSASFGSVAGGAGQGTAPGTYRAYLPPELTHWDVSAVPEAELALARTFLANRAGYTQEARLRIGNDLAGRISPYVAGPNAPMPPEWFLEAVLLVKSARS
jgi:uncharacterized RDD family membrane protein YckC